jgi:phosphate transport system protein
MEETGGGPPAEASRSASAAPPLPGRHALRHQEILWVEFLEMGREVVESLAKGIAALCDGRLEVVPEVKKLEEWSDSAQERIQEECLRVLALFEPVASDLRRMATVLKVSRDWERIADLAGRIARRARKLAGRAEAMAVPDLLKALARDVLARAHESYEALTNRDAQRARAVIGGAKSISRQQRQVRAELKESICRDPGQLEAWLQLMSTARHLERISEHATDIAQSVVYLQEGIIVRHKIDDPAADD